MKLLDKLGNPSRNFDSERPSASDSFEQFIRKRRGAPSGAGISDEVFSDPTPVVTSRVASLDSLLKENFQRKLTSNSKYRDMLETRRSLPAYKCRNEILEQVLHKQVRFNVF